MYGETAQGVKPRNKSNSGNRIQNRGTVQITAKQNLKKRDEREGKTTN